MDVSALRNFRERHNLSQEDLAKALGVTRNTIMNWESGKRMTKATIDRVDRFINEYSNSYLHDGSYSRTELQGDKHNLVPFWSVDLFKQGVSVEEEIQHVPPTYKMDVPEFRGCLAFEAHTDAMDGVIKSGSIIFTSKIMEWEKHLEYGQIYWIICSDGRKYLRYIKRYREDPRKYFLLESENKAYDEFEMPKDSINAIWLIHGHLSKRV